MPPTTSAKLATMSLGALLNVSGKIVTTRASDSSDDSESFHHVCSTCYADTGAVVQLSTRRVCNDHPDTHVFTSAECVDRCKAAPDGTLVHFAADEVAAIKGGMAGKHLALKLHPAGEVEHLRETGTVLLFQPAPGSETVVGLFLAMLDEGDQALIGKITLRKGGKTKIMRLRGTDHGIELVEVANPEGVWEFPAVEYPAPSAAEIVMASQLADALMEPFDPEAYRSDVAERIEAAIAAKTGTEPGEAVPTLVAAPAAPAVSLADQLAASLAAATATKEAA